MIGAPPWPLGPWAPPRLAIPATLPFCHPPHDLHVSVRIAFPAVVWLAPFGFSVRKLDEGLSAMVSLASASRLELAGWQEEDRPTTQHVLADLGSPHKSSSG